MAKAFVLAVWMVLGSAPAFASACGLFIGCQPPQGYHVGAPAPLIGMGLPGGLAVVGALLGAKLLRRKK
jgi:hypothetical protein